MRRTVKRSSKRRRTFSRDKCPSRSTAPIAPPTSSTMKPVMPSSTTSGAEPRLNAITGVPQAIASIITRPNGSGQSIGTNNVIAPLKNSDLSRSLISPIYSQFLLASRLDLLFEIILVSFVRLGGNLERYAAMLGNVDGEIDALFRRDAAQKCEIRGLDRPRP